MVLLSRSLHSLVGHDFFIFTFLHEVEFLTFNLLLKYIYIYIYIYNNGK